VCGGCFYAEVELNKDISEMEDTVSLAESTVNNIDTQVWPACSKSCDLISWQAGSYDPRSIPIRLNAVETQLFLVARDTTSRDIFDELNAKTSQFAHLYDAVQLLTEGYSLDGSADDINKFETPR